jgi:hypothetical protein
VERVLAIRRCMRTLILCPARWLSRIESPLRHLAGTGSGTQINDHCMHCIRKLNDQKTMPAKPQKVRRFK